MSSDISSSSDTPKASEHTSPPFKVRASEINKALGQETPTTTRSQYPKVSVGYVEPAFAQVAHRVFVVPTTGASIFLGPQGAANNTSLVREALKVHNVSAIVDCTMGAAAAVMEVHSGLVEYSRVPVRDNVGAKILPYLPGVAAFI